MQEPYVGAKKVAVFCIDTVKAEGIKVIKTVSLRKGWVFPRSIWSYIQLQSSDITFS